MLMGYLPFGGRVSIFYSSLYAADWLGQGMDIEGLKYEDFLDAVRGEGGLRIVAVEKNRPTAAIDRFKIF